MRENRMPVLWIAAVLVMAGAIPAPAATPAPIKPEWQRQAEQTLDAIREAVIAGVARGKKERIYVEFGGSLQRVRILEASPAELLVSLHGASVPIPWKRLRPRRLYAVGLKYLPTGDAATWAQLGVFCLVHGLLAEAERALDEAVRLDPEMRAEVKPAVDFLQHRERRQRARTVAAAAPTAPVARSQSPAAKRPAVAVADPVAAVLKKLGRAHFMLGLSSRPGDRWIEMTRRENGCRWDMRYQYLAGGVNTPQNWKEWNRPAGQFVTRYLTESKRMGVIPVFSWYQMFQSKPGGGGEAQANKRNCETPATMRQYMEDLKLFFQKAAEFGEPVILHHEPDLWGYFFIAREFRPNEPDKIRVIVKSTGLPELAQFDDTAAGFGQAIVALRDSYAPNVLLGWHASMWGHPDPRKYADFCKKCGKWDLIFTDASDRDAGWKIAHNYQAGNAWWQEKDFISYRDWSGALFQATRIPLVSWQVPIGNTIMAACNNTRGHYMDNRPQYWLDDYPNNRHIAEFAARGYIALLFGGGAGGCTSVRDSRKDGITDPEPVEGNQGRKSVYADDDGGYLRLRAADYYKRGALRLRAAR